jgi:hypothetical protein
MREERRKERASTCTALADESERESTCVPAALSLRSFRENSTAVMGDAKINGFKNELGSEKVIQMTSQYAHLLHI